MRIVAVSMLAGLILACDPSPTPENFVARSIQPLPESFVSRNVLTDPSGLVRYTLEEQVGKLLYRNLQDSSFTVTGRVLLPGDYRPTVQLIDQDQGRIYEGLLSREAAADAAYLAVATKLKGNELATLTVKDRAYSRVPNTQVPWNLLAAEARRSRPRQGTKVYWVQGVLLSSVDYKVATEFDATAGGKMTEAFAANGRLYDKSESTTYDHHVSMDLIDLDYVLENERPLLNAARSRDSAALNAVIRRQSRLPTGLRADLPARIPQSNQ
jgi:hypothetical protein